MAHQSFVTRVLTSSAQVLWNFYEAEELSINSLGFTGSILAPTAEISFSSGHLDGSVAAGSIDGDVEVKVRCNTAPAYSCALYNRLRQAFPYIPLTCRCLCPQSISFPPYSIFTYKRLNMSAAKCEGAIAVGGSASLFQYGVGEALDGEAPPEIAPGGNSAIIGLDLTWYRVCVCPLAFILLTRAH